MEINFKKYFKSSLRLQLQILFAILIIFSIATVSFFILQNENRVLKSILVRNGEEIVKNIAGNIADAISQTPIDDTTLIYVINSTMSKERKEIKYIRITNPDDTLILASNNVSEEWGKKYTPPNFLYDKDKLSIPYFIKDNEKIYDIRALVTTPGNKVLGIVHLGLSQKSIDEAISEATKTVVAIAFVIIVLGLIFSAMLANFLVKPIKLLMDGVSKITAGNYDINIDIKMHNEIDDLSKSFIEMAKSLKEKELIKVAFSRYVSSELLNELIKDRSKLHLGGEKRLVTVLFSDIRDFTSIAESLDPQEVVRLLNEYFSGMTEVIFKNKGLVNKYMGDAIMAVYGAPIVLKDHAKRAVNTALQMCNELYKLRDRWQKEGRPLINMKIGITTGEVVIGNVGSKEHMEYTVIGDTVNIAARLQALNRNYGTQILISESTYELVKDDFEARKVELVQFKGKTSLTLVYEVLGLKQREM